MTKIKTEQITLPAGRERKLIILIKEKEITDFQTIEILGQIIKDTRDLITRVIQILIKLKGNERSLVPSIIKILTSVSL